VPGNAIAGAIYAWRTTSIISIRRMLGSLQQIAGMCGGLRGLPLWLKLEPVKVRDGSTTVYCCHVELRAKDMAEVQGLIERVADMRSIVGPPTMMALPSPADETAEEQAEAQQEFHPEAPRERGNRGLEEALGK
jgi:hypothetical protein